MQTKDTEKCLDVIDLTFKVIDSYVRNNAYHFHGSLGVKYSPNDAIKELNQRFKEAGVGFQFESGELIRIDSEYLHSEVVKPVLYLLSNIKNFQGANSEFLSAHEHYRHKRYKECLVECLKSFESTMKCICKIHSWQYANNDTAKKLIQILLSNNFIPSYLQNQLSSIRTLLESGIPTIRNRKIRPLRGRYC